MLEGFFVSAAKSFAAAKDEKGLEKKFADPEGFEDKEVPVEGFSSYGAPLSGDMELASMIGRIVSLVFVLLLISFFGQYFWNNYVTKLFTIAKPATSVMQILGLFVFLRLMFP